MYPERRPPPPPPVFRLFFKLRRVSFCGPPGQISPPTAGDTFIPPPMRRPLAPPPMNGPRYNEFIQSQKVRVIDHEGENLGVMYTREAIEQAAEVGLDLVEVSPNADPPVAKFLDVGKFTYEAQTQANQARKTQKTQENERETC